jgi:hypothetical protein
MSLLKRGIRAGLAVVLGIVGCDLSVTEPRRSTQAHADAASGGDGEAEGGVGGSDAAASDADVDVAAAGEGGADVSDAEVGDAEVGDAEAGDAEAGTWESPPPDCPVDAGAPCCFVERIPVQGLEPNVDFRVLKVLPDGRLVLGGSEVQGYPQDQARSRTPLLFIGDGNGWSRVAFPTAEPVLQSDAGSSFGEGLFPQGSVSDIVQKENGATFAVGETSLVRDDGWAEQYVPLLYQENVGGWAAVPVAFPRHMEWFWGPARAALHDATPHGTDLLLIGSSSRSSVEEDFSAFTLRYDGTRFVQIRQPSDGPSGIWSDGETAYLFGNDYTYDEFDGIAGYRAVIKVLVGESWNYEALGAAPGTPEVSFGGRIEVVGVTEPIAVATASGGGLALISRTEGSWTYVLQTDSVVSDVTSFSGVATSGADLLVAQIGSRAPGVFEDTVLRWDGSSWSTLCTGGMRINDIAVSNGTLYLAGADASGGVLATFDLN